jgi:hypothetical protein
LRKQCAKINEIIQNSKETEWESVAKHTEINSPLIAVAGPGGNTGTGLRDTGAQGCLINATTFNQWTASWTPGERRKIQLDQYPTLIAASEHKWGTMSQFQMTSKDQDPERSTTK